MTDTKGSYAHGTLPGMAQLFREVNSVPDIQKEIKEALEKATQGPWSYYKNEYMGNYAWVSEWCVNGPCAGGIDNETDAHLIANSPTWLKYQQELIEQKDAEIEKLREIQRALVLTPMQKNVSFNGYLSKLKGESNEL